MRLRSNTRIVPEDYAQEDRPAAEKTAAVVNPLIEDLNVILNNGISFADNSASSVKTVTLKVNSAGVPDVNRIPLAAKQKIQGVLIINVKNIDKVTSIPMYMPFMDVSFTEQYVMINKINGLNPNERYTLTILFVA